MNDQIIITAPKADPDETYNLPHFGTYCLMREKFAQSGDMTVVRDSLLSAARLLQVDCPHCKTKRGYWCRRPDGRLYGFLHVTRWKKAYVDGFWNQVTIEVPDISDEVYGAR